MPHYPAFPEIPAMVADLVAANHPILAASVVRQAERVEQAQREQRAAR